MNLSPETLARIAKLADDIGCSLETPDGSITAQETVKEWLSRG